jgi:catechol 2,3-dioxygenase-like lactoylglutathione lyase family enzyme
MFTILGVDVAYLHSQRGSELAAWYRETLGLDSAFESGDWTELDVPGRTRLAVDTTSFPRSVVEAQPIMLSLRVDDLDAAVTDLAARGVTFHPSAAEAIFQAGPSRVATFCDPDGNWMQLSERDD